MSDYTKTTNFTAKDALTTGDPNKVIKGATFDTEFDALATASSTKANKVVSGTTNAVLIQTAGGDLADGSLTLPSGAVVGITDTQTLTNKTIDADLNTISNIDNSDIKIGAGINAVKISNGVVSNAEFDHLNGVTSALQTQIDSKLPASGGTDLAVADGGTGASTASGARTNLGLGGLSTLNTIDADEIVDYTAGDYWEGLEDSGTTSNATYVKIGEIYTPRAGTIRTRIGASNDVSNTTTVRVYKNGSAIGTERSTTSGTTMWWTEDFTFAAGDLIQLYAKSSGGTATGYIQCRVSAASLLTFGTTST